MDDYKKRALQPLEELHQRAFEFDQWTFERWAALCESPIEYLMAGHLFAGQLYQLRFTPMGVIECSIETSWSEASPDRFKNERIIEVWPQAKVAGYRVDFLILAGPKLSNGEIVKLVIECDGHDFHERTKEQAQRDKSRDRSIQALGYRVFRFTGSEIYRKSDACFEEALKFLDEQLLDDESFRKLRHPS